eukprot:750196-Hanusia_phi.AAC.6
MFGEGCMKAGDRKCATLFAVINPRCYELESVMWQTGSKLGVCWLSSSLTTALYEHKQLKRCQPDHDSSHLPPSGAEKPCQHILWQIFWCLASTIENLKRFQGCPSNILKRSHGR